MMRAALVVAFGVALVAGVNVATWRANRTPALASIAPAAGELAWELFGEAKRSGATWTFPPALAARDGQEVAIAGVLFPVAQLVEGGRLAGGIVAPPARFSCCGLTCDAKPQLLVFCDFAEPIPASDRPRLCRARGRLALDPTGSGWALSSLHGARVELLPDPSP